MHDSQLLPRYIYHLAEAANWSSIQQYGLLSASALLRLYGLQEDEHKEFERQQRTNLLALRDGIIIRDQLPMSPEALKRCLHEMTPNEWYELLNQKIFFWIEVERLERMLKANRRRPQLVMTIDTTRLLERYAKQVTLTPFNTGNARRQPAYRGRSSFVPYPIWCETRWTSEAEGLGTRLRPRHHRPVELTIDHAVPDVLDFVVKVTPVQPGETFMAAQPE